MKPRMQFMPFTVLLLYAIAVPLFFLEQTVSADDFIVSSENDSGPGTLRQAILDLNSSGSGTEPNSITFTLNVTTISLLTPLSAIFNSVNIDGFFVTGIDCNQLSPVDKPEQFSAAISVTIDGSQIPTTGFTPLVGLFICADDVAVRGLRIANFSDSENSQIAGIASEGNNTFIECCEVKNINGGKFSTGTSDFTVGIRGNTDTIISRCFVHNLNIANNNVIDTNTRTGAIVGISLFKTVRDCRVEHLQGGNIIYNTPGSSDSLNLISEWVIGIGNLFGSLNCSRQCECPTDCQDSECILVENCVVNCCQSGSVFATESADVTIESSSGIRFFGSKDIVISGCTVSNIFGGNATLSDGTFSLETLGAFGINTQSTITCLSNNTISEIHRGVVDLGGLDSSAELGDSVGIKSDSQTIITDNNSVSNVTCQKITASGTCTTIEDKDSLTSPVCLANLATPVVLASPICSGILFTGITIQLCNNTVTNINAGKRIANGEKSLITSGYAAGIWTNTDQEITAEDNTVQDIFGAELVAGPAARGIFGGIGSKGIALWTLQTIVNVTIIAERNTVERVCEQSLRTANGVPGEYIFIENLSGLTEILKPAAQTTGISIKSFALSFNLLSLQINDNTINTIIGSKVTGNNNSTGTMAAGINIEPATILEGSESCSQLNEMNINSMVQGNAINNILSGTNNSAYGILLDNTLSTLIALEAVAISPIPALFDIENNTITNVTGLGTPQSFEAPLLSLEGCGTINLNSITFVPFPYQPTTGIYTLFGNCSTISGNTITSVTEPSKNARGITTQASSDIEINHNTISKINGYGIFVGGATANIDFVNDTSGLFTEALFEDIFASVRNKIFGNSTFENTKQGIELGLIDWNSYFQVSASQCGGPPPFARTHQEVPEDSVSIFGNHGQVAPCIEKVSINRDTVTVDIRFKDSAHIFTNFIIQFFANSSNSVPHGEHPISDFSDPQFIITTDINGTIVQRFTFVPTHLVNKTDIISTHITLAEQQPAFVNGQEKGDTSEFTQQQVKTTPYPLACYAQQKPYSFIGQLCG